MDFQTPKWVCDYMVSLIPNHVKTVLEPTPGEGNLVKSLNGYTVVCPEDFWQVTGFYDCIVMNPPFTPMNQGYKILYRCMNMSNLIIALMPWFVLINSHKRTQDILNYGLRNITHLPRYAFQGTRVQTCILFLEKGYNNQITFNYIGRIDK